MKAERFVVRADKALELECSMFFIGDNKALYL